MSIADRNNNLTSFMMNGNLVASGADLAAEKATSNRRRGRGSGPGHLLQEGWVVQVETYGDADGERGG